MTAALARVEVARQPANADELRSAQEAVRSADAAVASAQARYTQVQAGATPFDVAISQSAVDQAAANVRGARARLDQVKAGPPAADVEVARSAVEQARAMLDLKQKGPTVAAIEAAEARLKQSEVQLAQAELALANYTLRAPFAGVVTSVLPREGEIVATGAPTVQMAKLDELQLETKDLDEVSAARVEIGQEVTISVAALEKRTFKGKVTAMAAQPTLTQSGDVNYTATVVLTEPAPELKWGMTAKVDFTREAPPS